MGVEARGDHRALHLARERVVDDGAEDDVGFRGCRLRDDTRGLVDFEHREVVAARDVEEDALGTVDGELEERRIDRGAGCFGGAAVAGAVADAHERRAGVLHDRFHVGEVDVDETVLGDEARDALDGVLEHFVDDLERFRERRGLIDEREDLVVRDRDEGVDLAAELLERLFGVLAALEAFEAERLRDDRDREDAKRAGDVGDGRDRAGARSAAETGGEEEHVRAFEGGLDLLRALFRRALPHLGVGAGSETLRRAAADRDLLLGRVVVEGLDVGVHGDEFNAADLALHHARHGVRAAAARAEHADHGAREGVGAHFARDLRGRIVTHAARCGTLLAEARLLRCREEGAERVGHGMGVKRGLKEEVGKA